MNAIVYRVFIIAFFCTVNVCTVFANHKDTLEVAVYDSPPFGMKTPSGKIGGLMVELWEDIAEDLDLNCKYKLTNMSDLMKGIHAKRYDVGLGAISITPKRERLVDFTHAVNPSGTGIATSKENNSQSNFAKWIPVLVDLLELIAGLLLMLLISATIVYLIERQYTKQDSSNTNIDSIADGLWWSAVTMTTVGYGDKVPNSRAGKVLGIVWRFISIIFFSLFTASASAKLMNSEEKSTISSLDDLRNAKVVAVGKSSGEEFLIREHIKYDTAGNVNDAIDKVLKGEADAVVSNVPVLKYHNKTNFKNQLLISEKYLLQNNMGIALQEESPLKEEIDLILLQKIAEPKWQYAMFKYIGK